jgi:MFS family permease
MSTAEVTSFDPPLADQKSTPPRKATVSITLGTVLEWYDFSLYGTAAAIVFPTVFFSADDPVVATLLSLFVFGSAFLARPLGAIVFGHFGDRYGRKNVLIATLVLMGLATAGIAVLPGYATIGVTAPLLLLLLRILQGVATGGEWGGAALMLNENGRRRAGFIGSFLSSAAALGGVLGTAAFLVLDLTLSDEDLISWGWRIPFALGILLVLLSLWMRRGLEETEDFRRAQAALDRGTANPVDAPAEQTALVAVLRHPRNVIALFLIRLAQNVAGYIWLVFALTYVTVILGISGTSTITAIVIAGLGSMFLSPLWGFLGDRFGYKIVMTTAFVLQVLYAFPAFLLLKTGEPAAIILTIFLGQALMTAMIESVQPAFFSSMFPTKSRMTGAALGREAGAAIGGGATPAVALALVNGADGSTWPVSLLVIGTSLLAVAAVYLARPVLVDQPEAIRA